MNQISKPRHAASTPASDTGLSIRTTVAALRVAVGGASLALQGRSTIPALYYLRLRADDVGATLVGTNIEQAVTMSIAPVMVERGGDMLLRGRPMQDILKLLPADAEVGITQTDLHAVVSCGDLTVRLAHLPVEDYPTLSVWPKVSPEEAKRSSVSFALPAGELLRLLASVAYCVSTEETRYYLNGIFLHIKNDTLASVATDGHRLMVARTGLPAGAQHWRGEIVPSSGVKVLRTLLRGTPGDAQVNVTTSQSKLRFIGPNWTCETKAIDGTFPEYDRVMPIKQPDAAKLVVDTPAALALVLRQVEAVGSERSRPVAFVSEGRSSRIRVKTPEQDEAEFALQDSLARWEGGKPPPPEFGFQTRYLRAAAAAFPGGFTLQVLGPNEPARIDGKEGIAILMPMRI